MSNYSKYAVAVILLGSVGTAAEAASVSLNLNYYDTAATNGFSATPSAINALAVPGSYNFENPDTTSVGGPATIAGTQNGFYDDFEFSITGASADSITSTISLPSAQGTQQISNLSERIYSANGLAMPTTGAVAGEVDSSTVFTNGYATLVQISPVVLAPGSYFLEVSGLTSAAGGAYSGTLNLAPVPLPASLPLLLTGLGGLGFVFRRRGRAS